MLGSDSEKIKGYLIITAKSSIGSTGTSFLHPAMSEGEAKNVAKDLGLDKDDFSLKEMVPPHALNIFIRLASGKIIKQEL